MKTTSIAFATIPLIFLAGCTGLTTTQMSPEPWAIPDRPSGIGVERIDNATVQMEEQDLGRLLIYVETLIYRAKENGGIE